MSQNSIKPNNINRSFRKIHRISSIWLLFFFLVISVTGILLGLKKHTGGYLLAKTSTGTSTNLQDWLPVNTLSVMHKRLLETAFQENILLRFPALISVPTKERQKSCSKTISGRYNWTGLPEKCSKSNGGVPISSNKFTQG